MVLSADDLVEKVFASGGNSRSLAVAHSELTNVGVDVEIVEHAVKRHLEVEFSHATDHILPSFGVFSPFERRVFLRDAFDGLSQLFPVTTGFGFDDLRDDGVSGLDAFKIDGFILHGEGVTGAGLLESCYRNNVTSVGFCDVLAVGSVHTEDS